MNPLKRHLLKPPHARASHRCTDREYIAIDLTPEVREFVNRVDSKVEDLSYDLEQVIKLYRTFKKNCFTPHDVECLSDEMLQSDVVKNRQDAIIIAEAAIFGLYPSISLKIHGFGYRESIIHMVKLNVVSRTRSIDCQALLAVI